MRAPHPSPSITLVTVPHGGLSAFGGDTVGRDALVSAARLGGGPPGYVFLVAGIGELVGQASKPERQDQS